jgi:hypothetical protein
MEEPLWVNVTLTTDFGLMEQVPITKISQKSVAEKNGKFLEYQKKYQNQC